MSRLTTTLNKHSLTTYRPGILSDGKNILIYRILLIGFYLKLLQINHNMYIEITDNHQDGALYIAVCS